MENNKDIDYDQLVVDLENFKENALAVRKVMDDLEKVIGSGAYESHLGDTVFRLEDGWIDALIQHYEPDAKEDRYESDAKRDRSWILWFCYENDFGTGGLKVKVGEEERTIETVAELVAFMRFEYNVSNAENA